MNLKIALLALTLSIPAISQSAPNIDKVEAQKQINAFAFKATQLKLAKMYKELPEPTSKTKKINGFAKDYVELNCLTIYTDELFWQTMPEIRNQLQSERKANIESDYYKKYQCESLITKSKVKLFLENMDY